VRAVPSENMQCDQIELRVQEDGERVVTLDGYHHGTPESTPAEYRRVTPVDSEQQAPAHQRLRELIAGRDRE